MLISAHGASVSALLAFDAANKNRFLPRLLKAWLRLQCLICASVLLVGNSIVLGQFAAAHGAGILAKTVGLTWQSTGTAQSKLWAPLAYGSAPLISTLSVFIANCIAGETLIKAIFFDYDGVLTMDKTGSLTTNRFLSQETGIPYEAIKAAFRKYNKDLNLGKTTHCEIWPLICTDLKCNIDFQILHKAFESTPINQKIFAFAQGLKKKYQLGIITENKIDRITHLRKFQNLDLIFSNIIVSSEVGSDKKNPTIFRQALSRSSVKPEETLFIDNSEENLIEPQKIGIETIFFDEEKNDVEGLINIMKNQFGIHV